LSLWCRRFWQIHPRRRFFSPDPEDAILIRDTLSSTARFGITTLDLPTLHCWLRARVNYAWQPPTLLKVKLLKRPNPEYAATHACFFNLQID